MTLVAAYQAAGVPVLVGDFLISSGGERTLGRKKVSRIRGNIAVGWTGSLLQAGAVLAPMSAELPPRPTAADLSEWLCAFDTRALGKPNLKLAGWVLDGDGAHCFVWDAAAPHVEWGDEWYVGSGGPSFEIFSGRYLRRRPPRAGADERDALGWLVATLAQLNCGDAIAPANARAIGVGGGYEALYWVEATQSFRYIDSILYYALRCHMTGVGRAAGARLVPLSHYHAKDELSVMTMPTEGEYDYAIHMMGPAAVSVPIEKLRDELDELISTGINLTADYYAGLMMFAHPTDVALPIPIVTCPWDRQSDVHGTLAELEMQVSPEAIEHWFALQAAEFRANPLPHKSLRVLPPEESEFQTRTTSTSSNAEKSAS